MLRKITFAMFVFAVGLGSAWLFVLRAPQSEVESGKTRIVASFYPLAYLVSIVGGEVVSVRTLVPAGAEPHDFEPSPRDFVEIGKADAFFYNGAGFEPWVKRWEMSGTIRSVHLADMASALKERNVPLINRGGVSDPHFWLDPVIFEKEAEIVRDTLIAIDPAHRDVFSENTVRLTHALGALDQRFQKGLASCPTRDIVVSHDSLGYLAARYGFRATAIAGISPDEESAPKDLARIAMDVRAKGVKYIFSETVASSKFSEAIAREIGGQTLVLNPLESLTPDEVQSGDDYISKMEMNLSNLQKAMTCL